MKENYLSILEKNAKRCLKRKAKITLGLIVSLMINGVAFGGVNVSNEDMYFSAGGCNIQLNTSGAANFFYDTGGSEVKVDTSGETQGIKIKVSKNYTSFLPIDLSVNNTSDITKNINDIDDSRYIGLNIKEVSNDKKMSSSIGKKSIEILNVNNDGDISISGEDLSDANIIGIKAQLLQKSQTFITNSKDGNINIDVTLNSGIIEDTKGIYDGKLYGIKTSSSGHLSISSVENAGNITVTGIIEDQDENEKALYINKKNIESVGISVKTEERNGYTEVKNGSYDEESSSYIGGNIISTASSDIGFANAIGILAESQSKGNSQLVYNSENSKIEVKSTSREGIAGSIGIKSISSKKTITNDGLIDVKGNEELEDGGEFSAGAGILSNVVISQYGNNNFDIKTAIPSIELDEEEIDEKTDEETLTQDILNTGTIDVAVKGNSTSAYGIDSYVSNGNLIMVNSLGYQESETINNSFVNEGSINVLATATEERGNAEAVGISNSGNMNSKDVFENEGSINVSAITKEEGESIAYGMVDGMDYMFFDGPMVANSVSVQSMDMETTSFSQVQPDPISPEHKMTNIGDVTVTSEAGVGYALGAGISSSVIVSEYNNYYEDGLTVANISINDGLDEEETDEETLTQDILNTGNIDVAVVGGEADAYGIDSYVESGYIPMINGISSAEVTEKTSSRYRPIYKTINNSFVNEGSINVLATSTEERGDAEAVGISNLSESYGYIGSSNVFENSGSINVSAISENGRATAIGMEAENGYGYENNPMLSSLSVEKVDEENQLKDFLEVDFENIPIPIAHKMINSGDIVVNASGAHVKAVGMAVDLREQLDTYGKSISVMKNSGNIIVTSDISAQEPSDEALEKTVSRVSKHKNNEIGIYLGSQGIVENSGTIIADKAIVTSNGLDLVLLKDGSKIYGDIETKDGNDIIYMSENTKIEGNINLGDGDDQLAITNGNIIGNGIEKYTIDGGFGEDNIVLENHEDVENVIDSKIINFETGEISGKWELDVAGEIDLVGEELVQTRGVAEETNGELVVKSDGELMIDMEGSTDNIQRGKIKASSIIADSIAYNIEKMDKFGKDSFEYDYDENINLSSSSGEGVKAETTTYAWEATYINAPSEEEEAVENEEVALRSVATASISTLVEEIEEVVEPEAVPEITGINFTRVGFASLADDENNELASILDEDYENNGDTELGEVYSTLENEVLNSAQDETSAINELNEDLEDMKGTEYSAYPFINLSVTRAFAENTQGFMDGNGSKTSMVNMETENGNHLYVNALGNYGDYDDNATENFDFDTYGVIVGNDKRLKSGDIIGITYGYADTDVDYDDGGSGDTKTFHVGGYYKKESGQWALKSTLALDYNKNDVDRVVWIGSDKYTPSTDFDTYVMSIGTEINYDYNIGNWTFRPLAALNYSRIEEDSFKEDTILGLEKDSEGYNSITSEVGLKAIRRINLKNISLKLNADISWVHEYGDIYDDRDYKLAGDTYEVSGLGLNDDSYSVAIGIDTDTGTNWNFNVKYSYSNGSSYEGNKVSVGFVYEL